MVPQRSTGAAPAAEQEGAVAAKRGCIQCLEMQHINIAARDFERTMAHFTDVLGAQYVYDIPGPQWHAVLVYVGGVLFELFLPEDFLLNGRYGPHYVGIEYQVHDLGATRHQLAASSVGLIRDIGMAFHTEPEPCLGIAFEFYDHSFHNEPFEWKEPLKPADYWRHDHPIGYTGLKRYSVAVADHDAGMAFFRDTFVIDEIYEEDRPFITGRVTGFQLADTVVELISPTGSGVIDRHLRQWGDGIRSVVFGVHDLDAAAAHFAGHGVELAPGDQMDTLAIMPADNRGVMMEFAAE